jgi:hypothetical protein
VLLWEHAIPADPETVDRATGTPRLTAGGRRHGKDEGHFGETFHPPYSVYGYLQNKITTTFSEVYGVVDDHTMQLTVPAIIVPSVADGIRALPVDLNIAYENGQFVTHKKGETWARDRFRHLKITYIVKSTAVPIICRNATVAWRMLVAADTL